MSKQPISIFWFRRDLRLSDNAGLYHALRKGLPVLPIFIFDKNILEKLPNKEDKRVTFIYETIATLKKELNTLGSDLLVLHNSPKAAWTELFQTFNIKHIFTNHDYEPYAIKRDLEIESIAKNRHTSFYSFKDQCIFEKSEVVKDDGLPYTVFTPYSKKWKSKLNAFYLKSYPTEKYFNAFLHIESKQPMVSMESLGFKKVNVKFSSTEVKQQLIKEYQQNRDFPAIEGTSHLGIHFRFGTISIREKVRKALALSDTFLNELIWRDFYMMILHYFPQIGEGKAFRSAYDFIEWRNNEKEFTQWCQGKTGYPIVDAGMRELNETGFMHNRVRMIVASFLTKHLLIDWRWGEAYFAEKLLDFDFSANNGGWQWAAGCGTDAAPYFRVFSPKLQTEKFDKQNQYIKKWIPEFGTITYPKPIVDHDFARKRCLEVYKKALSKE